MLIWKKHHYDDDHLSCRSFALFVTPLNTKLSWRGARSWQWKSRHTQTMNNNGSTTKRRQWRWACVTWKEDCDDDDKELNLRTLQSLLNSFLEHHISWRGTRHHNNHDRHSQDHKKGSKTMREKGHLFHLKNTLGMMMVSL